MIEGLSPFETLLAGTVVSLAGAIVYLFHQQAALRKETNQKLELRNKDLENRLALALSEVRILEKEKQALITQLTVFSSTHDSSPLPQWIKDEDGKVLAVNKAYEKLFLIPRGYTIADYRHHTDDEVWSHDIAEAYRENDRIVWKTRQIMDTVEPIINSDGTRGSIRVVKYPRFASGIETPIGIAGIAIPEKL